MQQLSGTPGIARRISLMAVHITDGPIRGPSHPPLPLLYELVPSTSM